VLFLVCFVIVTHLTFWEHIDRYFAYVVLRRVSIDLFRAVFVVVLLLLHTLYVLGAIDRYFAYVV
jgi:hypothetical protein